MEYSLKYILEHASLKPGSALTLHDVPAEPTGAASGSEAGGGEGGSKRLPPQLDEFLKAVHAIHRKGWMHRDNTRQNIVYFLPYRQAAVKLCALFG